MKQFKNKIAFVTGAATGIGRATAITLANQGAKVIVADINEEEGSATVKSILDNNGLARYVQLNVAVASEVESVIMSILSEEGRIDLAVNNAGIGGVMAPIHKVKLENWQRTINVNLSGLFYCLQAEIKCMLQNGGGKIVNVASIAGVNGMYGGSAYSATKHAVIGLTKTAAIEYGSANLRVNAVCPGLIQTDIIKDIPQKIIDYNNNIRVPLKSIGQPQEVADSIAWLLSDQSSYINGHSLYVDGGFKA